MTSDLRRCANTDITDLRAFYHLAFLHQQVQHKSYSHISSTTKHILTLTAGNNNIINAFSELVLTGLVLYIVAASRATATLHFKTTFLNPANTCFWGR